MSREWKSSEALLLDDGYTYECLESKNRVTQITVGVDGLAVAVKTGGHGWECIELLQGLTLAQLRWIFSDWTDEQLEEDGVSVASCAPGDDGDEIKEWSDLDARCHSTPINTYGAGDQSGTHDFFGEVVFCKDCFSKGAEYFKSCSAEDVHSLEGLGHDAGASDTWIQQRRPVNCYVPSEDDDLLLQWLEGDIGGIAYFGFAHYAKESGRVDAVAIADDKKSGVVDTRDAIVKPTQDTIIDGSYKAFTRNLYMNVHNEAWNLTAGFMKYGFSATGQLLVHRTGYVTVNDAIHAKMMQRINEGAEEGGNKRADYVPVPPASCLPGTGLNFSMYENVWGTEKIEYRCDPCPAGTFKDNDESSECAPCPPGFHSGVQGKLSCEACLPGTFAGGPGSITCSNCSENSFQPLPGQASCAECATGRFTELEAQSTCTSCPLGTYMQNDGNYTCEACPRGMTTNERASTQKASCKCPEGFYLAKGGTLDGPCEPCLEGMACAFGSAYEHFFNGDRSVKTSIDAAFPFPVVMEGYMTRLDDVLKVFRCYSVRHCPGGVPGSCAALRDTTQVACGTCVDGTYESGGECNACEGNYAFPLVMAVLAGICIVSAMTVTVNKDLLLQTSSQMMCVIMASQMFLGIQTMSVFSSFNFVWFEPMLTLFKVVNVLTFDITVLRTSCMAGSNPVVVYVLRQCVAPFAIPWIWFTLVVKKTKRPSTKVLTELFNAVGTIFQIFFISIVISATVPLVVYRHPGESGRSLTNYPAILFGDHREHTSMLITGCLALCAVPLPFLACVVYGTAKYPQFVANIHNPRQQFVGLDSFRFLFFRYKAERYYYGLFQLLRNLCLCLVPVVIPEDPAFQVILTAIIIVASSSLQQQQLPWRVDRANDMDVLCSNLLLLLLICGSMAADFDIHSNSVKIIGVTAFVMFFFVGLVAIAAAVWFYFRPQQTFSKFICHHKASAQAQARLLKMMLSEKTRKPVFIDSDDLRELDKLFDIVKTSVEHLVVYLTRETLSRPWCAGEIVTAFKWQKQVTAVITPSFAPPSEEDYEQMDVYLDLKSCSLAPYGITTVAVSQALRKLLSEDTPFVYFRTELKGSLRFDLLVNELVTTRDSQVVDSEAMQLQDLPDEAGSVLISSESRSDEAMAAALIVARKARPQVLHFMAEGMWIIDEHDQDEDRILQVIDNARAVLVLLSSGTLSCIEQIQAIVRVMSRREEAEIALEPPPAVVPITLPGFVFPSDEFYRGSLPRILNEDLVGEVAAKMRGFFNTIAISLPIGASDQMIDTQVTEVLARIPRSRAISRISTQNSRLRQDSEGSNVRKDSIKYTWRSTSIDENMPAESTDQAGGDGLLDHPPTPVQSPKARDVGSTRQLINL